ncbi:MAG: acetyl-CoA carboxylase biotin carboxyl carrier protein [Armatimonadota bacterium]
MAESFQVSDVEELLAVMEQWGITELHLAVEDASVDLVRAVPQTPALTAAPAAASLIDEEPAAAEPVLIHAPVVGVFHLTRSGFPQGVPQTGDHVTAGQTIGSIELMHIPTDLVSPVSGTITAILAEDGAGVEYFQSLMAISPFEEASEHEMGLLPPPAY